MELLERRELQPARQIENVNLDGEHISDARARHISGKMSWLLRHQTGRFWSCDVKGRVRYEELIQLLSERERKPASHADVLYVVTKNDKKRFQLWYFPGGNIAHPVAISAMQGHSGQRVRLQELGETVTVHNRGKVYVHGTAHRHVHSILLYGLVPGGIDSTPFGPRPVHLCRKLPHDPDRLGELRDKYEVIVYLNPDKVSAAVLRGVMELYHTNQDTTCCNHTIGPQYIERIVEARHNITLFSMHYTTGYEVLCPGCGKTWPPGVQFCLDRSCWHAMNEKALQEEIKSFRRGQYEERQEYFRRKYGFEKPVPAAKKVSVKSSKRKFGRSDSNARIRQCRKSGPFLGHAHRYDTDSEYRQQCYINGVPRTLIVPIFDTAGKPTGRVEVLEKAYVDRYPDS